MNGSSALVAGAGIWGCTVARRLAEAGRKVLVLEKRASVGGNCRCETDPETGIEVHAYGSHVFHTHDRKVWDFVRRFTEFNGYQHKVLARWRGKTYHLPIGLTLVNKFFGVELKPGEVDAFLAEPGRRDALFDAFFRGYTSKQWGCPPEGVDPSVIRRVPVRNNYDTNYFNDTWQGIPSNGYNALFDRLLDHPNITIECNCEFKLSNLSSLIPHSSSLIPHPSSLIPHPSSLIPHSPSLIPHSPSLIPVYYSGPIDALFNYRFGALPWRSLRFERETLSVPDFQGTSVVNYTEAEVPYTRIHEFKHYHPERKDVMSLSKTVVVREYPRAWEPGDEPYYPVNNPSSAALLAKYRAEADRAKLVIGGRLGTYRYCDMDQAVADALAVDIEQ